MRDSAYTRQERHFITLMRVWMVLFLGAAIIFISIPDILLGYLNDLGRVFFGWTSPEALGGGKFWQVMTFSLLITLTFISYLAQQRPLRNISFASAIIVSKLVSSLGFLGMLLFVSKQFSFFCGFIIDGLICLITWRSYVHASRNRM